jgi:ABC-type lipoprotein release transport system permease subunit
MNVAKMAWRNVWRNRRRSIVTIAAMTLALCVELLYAGLVIGYMKGMEKDVIDLEVGDVQIFAPGYRDKPSIYTRIDNPDQLLAKLDEAGYPASARVLGGGLAATERISSGVQFRGVDVERDAKVTLVGESLAEGKWLDPADPHGVVIGRRLAQTLAVELGDELVVLSQAADGSTANDLYYVRGVLLGIADGTDRAAVFMTQDAVRELLVLPEGAHQIIVRRPEEVDLAAATAHVRSVAPDLDVQSWRELMPIIANMFESVEGMVYIIFFIIYVAVGILILNSMLMAVFERVREFGLIKALGVGPSRILSLIFLECGVQALIAIVIGTSLALPGMWYLQNVGIDVGNLGGMNMMGVATRQIWYGMYDASTVRGPLIMLVVIVVMAALYPALKAALIRPVAAMRHT